MGRKRAFGGASRVALVGILSALSLVVLYLAALAPTGRLGLVAAAGLVPAAAVVSAGLPAGVFCYGATGLLGLFLSPDKGQSVLYLLFFGLYPLVKCLFERLRRRVAEWVCKLAYFNLTFALLWLGLRPVLLSGLPTIFESLWVFCLIGNVVFVIYDLGFSRLIALYAARIDKWIRHS